MEKTNNTNNTRIMVMTAFFAGIVYLGIQIFRIPVPSAFGTPFLHFGHIFVVLSIICLGPKYSAIASVIGYLIFDIVNGYIQAIPNVLLSTIIKCTVVGLIYIALSKKAQGDYKKMQIFATVTAAIYGLLSIIIDFILSTIELMLVGNAFATAITIELAAIPATAINGVFTVIGISILYLPVTSAYNKIMKKAVA